MDTIARPKRWTALALFTTLWFPVSAAHSGKLYKWIDDSGQTRYGDHIPAEYAKQRNETLNDQGIVVNTKAAAKTAEQRAEERRQAKLKAEEERKLRERLRRDRILLDTFTNVDEMISSRDGKIDALEALIRITKDRITKIQQRLLDLRVKAANLERSGKPVPEKLQAEIREAHKQIQENLDYIEHRMVEQQVMRETFEADIKRFRELKTAEAEAEAKAEAAGR